MKCSFKHLSAAFAATLALAQPQIAMAQSCVSQNDVADTTVYVMPLLMSALTSKCSKQLASGGFIKKSGTKFVAPYVARQNAAWPGAYKLLLQFATKGTKDDPMASMLGSLPEDAVRPFVNAIIEQKVAEQIKVKDCTKIERGVEMLAPLPTENMGGLAAFLLDMSGVKNPALCPYTPK